MVLFMDLLVQCVNGMFMGPVRDLRQLGSRIRPGYVCHPANGSFLPAIAG